MWTGKKAIWGQKTKWDPFNFHLLKSIKSWPELKLPGAQVKQVSYMLPVIIWDSTTVEISRHQERVCPCTGSPENKNGMQVRWWRFYDDSLNPTILNNFVTLPIHPLNVLILELQIGSQGLSRCLKHQLSTLQLSKHVASLLTVPLMQFKVCEPKLCGTLENGNARTAKPMLSVIWTSATKDWLPQIQIFPVSLSSFYPHSLCGEGESSHCPSSQSWELLCRLQAFPYRTASGQICQHSFIPNVCSLWQRDESWELPDLPFWELLQGRMLGMSETGESRLGIPLQFSFSSFQNIYAFSVLVPT